MRRAWVRPSPNPSSLGLVRPRAFSTLAQEALAVFRPVQPEAYGLIPVLVTLDGLLHSVGISFAIELFHHREEVHDEFRTTPGDVGHFLEEPLQKNGLAETYLG